MLRDESTVTQKETFRAQGQVCALELSFPGLASEPRRGLSATQIHSSFLKAHWQLSISWTSVEGKFELILVIWL